jgi:hypothetical protein
MKRAILLILGVSFIILAAGPGSSLQFASMSWNEFVGGSELIAEAQLVRAEYENYRSTYTFQTVTVFKGPDVKRITIVQNPRMDGPFGGVGDTCFLAMKRKQGAWAFAWEGRSYWPVRSEQTHDLKAVSHVVIDDHLIRGIPGLERKKYRVRAWLLTHRFHEYEAGLYLLDDVRRLLRAALK